MIQHDVNVKVIIIRNQNLGMIREIQNNVYGKRHIASSLDGSPDFVALAASYGIDGETISYNDEISDALDRLIGSHKPYVLQCMVAADQPSVL